MDVPLETEGNIRLEERQGSVSLAEAFSSSLSLFCLVSIHSHNLKHKHALPFFLQFTIII